MRRWPVMSGARWMASVGLPEELALKLSSAGVGSTTSTGTWFITRDLFATTPDRAIRIVETGGFPSLRTTTGTECYRPTFQVAVRSPVNGFTTGREKLDAVIAALHDTKHQTYGNRVYLDIAMQGDALSLGTDDNGRMIYAANFTALRSRTT